MTEGRFCRYQLRTTDLIAARTFYGDVLGSQVWGGDVSVSPLPERIAALGVPSHWLGHIAVADAGEMVGRAVAHGAQQLGPVQAGDDGSSHVVLRDPFGAVVAVGCQTAGPDRAPVAWHLSQSQDHEQAFAWYSRLFGWIAKEVLDPGPQMGRQQVFAWDESGPSVGSMANTTGLSHIHPHWLFFFRVTGIEDSIAMVRARGGQVLGPMQISSGDVVAACDDPQGAAFGLYQFARGVD